MSNNVLVRARKEARRRWPHLKGRKLKVMVSALYHAMGGPMNKSLAPVYLQKAVQPGSTRPAHKWLRREGSPGNWTYSYTAEPDEPDPKSDLEDDTQEEDPQEAAPPSSQGEQDTQPKAPGSAASPQGNSRTGRVMLPTNIMQASEIRDATPEDLSNPRLILWLAVTESAVATIRQQKRYIGLSGKATLYATRQEALQYAAKDPEVLIGVRVRQAELKPEKPAKNLTEALFNADPTQGGLNPGASITGQIPGHVIIAIVRPDNPMWPQVAPRADTGGDF